MYVLFYGIELSWFFEIFTLSLSWQESLLNHLNVRVSSPYFKPPAERIVSRQDPYVVISQKLLILKACTST